MKNMASMSPLGPRYPGFDTNAHTAPLRKKKKTSQASSLPLCGNCGLPSGTLVAHEANVLNSIPTAQLMAASTGSCTQHASRTSLCNRSVTHRCPAQRHHHTHCRRPICHKHGIPFTPHLVPLHPCPSCVRATFYPTALSRWQL